MKTSVKDIRKLSKLNEQNGREAEMTQSTVNSPCEYQVLHSQEKSKESPCPADGSYQVEIIWEHIILAMLGISSIIYAFYLICTAAKYQTTLYAVLLGQVSGLGITAGAHRLWSHRAYKAKWPLKIILIILQTMAFQFTIFNWVRDHRVHHKFVDTNADPYNAKRGFFFSHMGWLLCRMHPDAISKRRSIDMKDLLDDPIVQFQKRHFISMVVLFSIVVPMIVPLYLWDETLNNTWHVAVVFRTFNVANNTALVNSAAHYWGYRPYDRSMTASENPVVAILANGEGWHNYHHAFPWDYKTAELGNYRANLTTAFIDFCAKIGWAYDLKTVPASLVHKRAQRTGSNIQNRTHVEVWGWGDKDMQTEDMNEYYNTTGKNKK